MTYGRKWNPLFDGGSRKSNGKGSSVRVVRSTTGGPAAGTYDRLLAETRARWRHTTGDAIDGFRFAIFGDEWKDL